MDAGHVRTQYSAIRLFLEFGKRKQQQDNATTRNVVKIGEDCYYTGKRESFDYSSKRARTVKERCTILVTSKIMFV